MYIFIISWIGIFKRNKIILLNNIMLNPIPITSTLKKSNLCDLKFVKRFLEIFLKFILFSEEIKSLYIPVINAIVPPETPGIKSAMPISIPLIKIIG